MVVATLSTRKFTKREDRSGSLVGGALPQIDIRFCGEVVDLCQFCVGQHRVGQRGDVVVELANTAGFAAFSALIISSRMPTSCALVPPSWKRGPVQ